MSSAPLRWAYTGLALLGAAVLGAYSYERLTRATPASPPVRVLKVPGDAPRVDATPAPTGVPLMRPTFTLHDLAGKPRSISEWDGKALIINFWATWCAPCRREIPLLNRIHREYAAKGIEVVGIAVDFAEDVATFTKRIPLEYGLLVGEQEGLDAAKEFGVQSMAFPFTAFTDRRGDVLLVHLGELHPAQAEAILGVVQQVDAGTLTADAGRTAIRSALAALPREPSGAAVGH